MAQKTETGLSLGSVFARVFKDGFPGFWVCTWVSEPCFYLTETSLVVINCEQLTMIIDHNCYNKSLVSVIATSMTCGD